MGWSFVGGDTKRETNTSATSVTLSITSPVANNLLIAGIHVRRSTPIATPSGWTLIRKYENPGLGPANISAALFYRISDGAETGVTFSWGHAYEAACFYQEISGLATSGVLHGSDDDTTNVSSSSSSGGFGSLTPTEQPGLAVIFSAYLVSSSSSSLSYNDGFSSASTGPSGGTNDPYVELGYKGYSSLSAISPSTNYSVAVRNYGVLALFKEPSAPSSIAGSLSATLGSAALAATGTVTVAGSGAAALGGIGASGSGQIDIMGSLDAALGSVVLSAAGALPVTATLAGLLGALPITGAGGVTVTGEAASLLAGASLGGSGVIGSVPISGELGATLGSLAASGAGAILVSGALAQALAQTSLVSASGVAPISGALGVSLGAVAVDALGGLSITGSGAVMLDVPGSLAAGSVGITGVLADALASIGLAAASREGSPGVLQGALRLYPALAALLAAQPALQAEITAAAALDAQLRIT